MTMITAKLSADLPDSIKFPVRVDRTDTPRIYVGEARYPGEDQPRRVEAASPADAMTKLCDALTGRPPGPQLWDDMVEATAEACRDVQQSYERLRGACCGFSAALQMVLVGASDRARRVLVASLPLADDALNRIVIPDDPNDAFAVALHEAFAALAAGTHTIYHVGSTLNAIRTGRHGDAFRASSLDPVVSYLVGKFGLMLRLTSKLLGAPACNVLMDPATSAPVIRVTLPCRAGYAERMAWADDQAKDWLRARDYHVARISAFPRLKVAPHGAFSVVTPGG